MQNYAVKMWRESKPNIKLVFDLICYVFRLPNKVIRLTHKR